MNIEARKILFVQDFLKIDNEKIINDIEQFFYKTKSKVFEENLNPMTLEQFNEDIDKAIDDEHRNRLTNAKDLKKKIQEWN
jgi:hypothetical protein